jgi:hypothetical protein
VESRLDLVTAAEIRIADRLLRNRQMPEAETLLKWRDLSSYIKDQGSYDPRSGLFGTHDLMILCCRIFALLTACLVRIRVILVESRQPSHPG